MNSKTNFARRQYEIKKDKERKDALVSGDAIKYFDVCNAMGITPEDEHLYERGQVESMMQRKLDSGLENAVVESVKPVVRTEIAQKKERKPRARYVSKEKYENFLNEAAPYMRTEFGAYDVEKRQILQKYFPKSYGPGAKKDIRKFDNVKVGSILKHIYDAYGKR